MKNNFFNISSLPSRITDLYRVISAKIDKKKCYPLYVQFIITFKCNLSCKYCDYPSMVSKELSTEKIFKMIDELAAAGMRKISIVGGEPLLHKDISKIIAYIKRKKIFCNIITNGVLFEEKINELEDIDLVIFSLDGHEEIHDLNTAPGVFKKVINGLELCRKHKIPSATNTVINSYNHDKLDFILELSKKNNYPAMFQPVESFPLCPSNKVEVLLLQKDILKKTYNYLIAKKKEGYRITYSNHHLKSISSGESFKQCEFAGRLLATILPDGRVAPCNPMIFKQNNWLSGNEIGYTNAMKNMPQFNCNGCFTAWAEINDILSLNLKALYENLKSFK